MAVNIVLGFVVIGLVLFFVIVYNGLVTVKNNVRKAWGNIDVLLKQRHDELPKLVKTCEAYMSYEKDTLSRVIALRNSAAGQQSVAGKARAEGELTAVLHKLFALAENYPDLKSQENFRHLQQRISGLEENIADRREFYNEAVNNYNIRIESLPDRFVAGLMGLQAQEMFAVSGEEKRDVAIDIRVPS